MTELPTTHDYFEHVSDLMRDQREDLRKAIDGIVSKAAAAGRLRSGATMIEIADRTKEHLRGAAGLAFAQEKHVIKNIPMQDEEAIEAATVQVLKNFTDEIGALARSTLDKLEPRGGAATKAAVDRMALEANLNRFVKSQRFGFSRSLEPVTMPSTVNNNVTIGTAVGSTVQQGTTNSRIQADIHIDMSAVTKAVETLEGELRLVDVRSEDIDNLAADLASVKAQIRKKSPAFEVLKQLGASVRNIAEGALGGALTAPVAAAALSLASALGG